MEEKVEMANDFLRTGMTGVSIKYRGQQIDYASQIMILQHRSHVFPISIVDHYADLIRWYRAGAVVSESFSYVDGPSNWLALSICGHETCGYLAWGIAEKRLVFLKDGWRADIEGSASKADMYAILDENQVPCLPAVCAGGDVFRSDGTVESTVAQEYIRNRIVQHLALPLRMVRNAKELLIAIRNTLKVIKVAYYNAGILH
ncbi:hypothetical protein BDY19DRAFT_992827 [Irpex rosettiformis]|uniref:Uncharacterized protein n=1 Tax=Irpex rosettiformis TaxID=378272 RepID=A0ACB8U7E1_9APHY|nr:hypothetical protein BDY19DRAFT_992827 [Irpex rosettiformis]